MGKNTERTNAHQDVTAETLTRPACPSRPPVLVTPRPPRLLVSQATPTGPQVYLIATKIWYRLKRFSRTKCHNIHVWYHLKRFLGTVCYEHGAWLRPAWRFFGGTPADAERVVW